MAWKALPIATGQADTPQRIYTPTAAQPNMQVHAVLIQVLPSNSGRIVIGDKDNITATTVTGNVLASLPPPTTNVYPSCNAGVPPAPAGLDLKNIWWCPQINGEGISISYLEC